MRTFRKKRTFETRFPPRRGDTASLIEICGQVRDFLADRDFVPIVWPDDPATPVEWAE